MIGFFASPNYPAIHVLGLNNEDSVLGGNYMVDLGSTICRWYGYVVDIEIDIGIEENLFSKGNLRLSYPSLYGSFYRSYCRSTLSNHPETQKAHHHS